MSKIRVLMCPADRPPYITNIENSLENMQSAVGGYIEAVTLSEDPKIVLVCDEEGRIKQKPLNQSTPHPSMFGQSGEWMMIVGDCFLCGVDGEEFADLPEEQKSQLLKSAKETWKKCQKVLAER
jgi:hypothetical protein